MPLTISRLNDTQLSQLGEEFDRILNAKHAYIWRDDVLDLIQYMRDFNPQWTNYDIYDRVGDTFVDQIAQAIQDNFDWEETLEEIAITHALNYQQKIQFKQFLNCDIE